MVKRGLGKGLDALFPTEENTVSKEDKVVSLRITEVEPNAKQPRKQFSEEPLEELASSIKEHGIIQPIVVTKNSNGFYTIIAGERRWRAGKMAGLKEIPAIVRTYDAQTASEIALIENLQRENLNPIEEADGYRNLMDLYGLTQEQISEKIGKSRSAVANALRLLTLKEPIRALVMEGKLSAGHARALLSLPTEAQRMELAEKTMEEGLSVRVLEKLCAVAKPKKKPVQYNTELREMEQILSKKMGTRVRITGDYKKGKIEIPYTNEEDFERILEIFGK